VKDHSECDIYGAIGIGHSGVVKFFAGGNVLFPAAMTDKAVKVTVQCIRGNLGVGENAGTYLSVRPVDRPLWKYDTEEELFKGFLAVKLISCL
jgi:hypothetical protein